MITRSFERGLHKALNSSADKILVPFQKLLDRNDLPFILNLEVAPQFRTAR